jgi:hypothetical protein
MMAKYTTSEDERQWIPPERLRLSAVGFYRYIGPLRFSEGVSRFCMCRWARKCIYPCRFATPKNACMDLRSRVSIRCRERSLASKRRSGEVGGLNCYQLFPNKLSCFFQCHFVSRTEPWESHQETDFDFAFLIIALCYITITFWNNGRGN